MSDTRALDDARYVSLTTYKNDGTGVSSPVWIAGSDSRYLMITDDDSWKVRRIRANHAVELTPCDIRGRVAADVPTFAGTAEILTGSAVQRAEQAVARKYPIATRLIGGTAILRHAIGRTPATPRVGLEITITS